MPPRKRAKRAHSSTPQGETTVQSSANTPESVTSAKAEEQYNIVTDPWTDEQEIALLNAVIKWKPVGVHKHFRMLAIADYLKTQGYAPSTTEHMRIPGIWKKLGTLYNLEALDEREDSVMTDMNEDEEASGDMFCPFEPPDDEYGDMMFDRRLAANGSSSPVTSRHAESRRGSTVADTDEPQSSPAPSRGRKSNRSARPSTRGTRSTRLQVEIGAGSEGKASDDEALSDADTGANEEGEEEGEEGSGEARDSEDEDEAEPGAEKGGARSTRAHSTRSKQKDQKPATRRTGRRR